MRDFNSGDIYGNVHISDGSPTSAPAATFKPFNECSIEELFNELKFRRYRLAAETAPRTKLAGAMFIFAVVVLAAVLIWYKFSGDYDRTMLAVTIMGIMLPSAISWSSIVHDTPVMKCHRDAIETVTLLLKMVGYSDDAIRSQTK